MRSLMTSRYARKRQRLAAGVMAGTMVLAACGGSDDASSGAQGGDVLPAVDDSDDGGSNEPVTVASGAGLVDLVGTDVIPEAEIESNLLPSVVLDDVTNGRKVNFRNLVPQEKPILLWMYAPH